MSLTSHLTRSLGGLAVGAAMLAGASSANAAITWTLVEANGAPNIGSQFSVEVSEVLGRVQFEFRNNVGTASSITDIYFDDKLSSVLALPMSLVGSAGVSFSQGASPPNLPGGNNISFAADFTADSNAPTASNGINAAGEFLRISFDYAGGANLASVISQLESGELVLGLHIQALAGGRSQSYASDWTPVPEPATLALFGLGLAGLGAATRRRKAT